VSELSKIEGATGTESRARAAAELVLGHELLQGPVPLPDFVSLMAGRSRWRRRGLVLATVGSMGVVAFATVLMLREPAPISYVVDGAVAIADGVIDAAGIQESGKETGKETGNRSASVHFSEGSEVGLAPGARLRIVARNAHGASLALDRGSARFAVSHLSGAHWSVATGPFTVEVIGTRFSLDWSPRDERLVVDLTSGSVQVRGASVGGPVAMHAGERLIATASDRRVTLLPLAEVQVLPGSDRLVDRPASGPAEHLVDHRPLGVVTTVSASPATSRLTRRGNRRPQQLALATPSLSQPLSSMPVVAPSPLPESPPIAEPRSDAQPPAFAPEVPPSMVLAAGGAVCAREGAQYRFERAESGISIPDYYTLAFSTPRPDRTHSWCGQGSLRVDASFNDSGRRNFFGRFPKETGEVVIKLHRTTDFTGKTVTVHFFVDGPADARFTAELVVVNRGRWVNGPPSGQMAAGRWWTISHRFETENESGVPGSSNPGPFPVGGTSPVSDCDRLGLAIHSTGGRRVWTGAVYVDDVGWR
jgi:FecR protein